MQYGKVKVVTFTVVPSPSGLGNEVVSLLNNILAISGHGEYHNMGVWFDNESLYRICEK